jgi:class 3 adenylate cyclase
MYMDSRSETVASRFVARGVLQRLTQHADRDWPGKHVADVAVLFVDVQGCSRLCETLSPPDMNHLIEVAFGCFFDCVHAAGGDVNEIMGDGFMALFEGRPLKATIHAAAQAALAIHQYATTRPLAASLPEVPFMVNIGLHGGSAFVGVTRFIGRTGERWTYTASGPVTNIAARLCALAQDGAILVSGRAATHLADVYGLEPMGAHAMRNIARAIEVYQLRGKHTEL